MYKKWALTHLKMQWRKRVYYSYILNTYVQKRFGIKYLAMVDMAQNLTKPNNLYISVMSVLLSVYPQAFKQFTDMLLKNFNNVRWRNTFFCVLSYFIFILFIVKYVYLGSCLSFKHVWLNNQDIFRLYNFIRILSSFLKSALVRVKLVDEFTKIVPSTLEPFIGHH